MVTGFDQSHSERGVASTDLPHDAGSESELLYSTHLFAVEVLSLEVTPWALGADRLERRRLQMDLKLLDVFKGSVSLERNETFRLKGEQRRESEFVVSDYHGLWSHITPAAGVRYLVVAKAAGITSPDELMGEESCQGLLDYERAREVQIALEAERIFQEVSLKQDGKSAQLAAARALLRFTQERCAACSDVFARYLWARVRPIFVESDERPLTEVLALIMAEDASVALRGSLIADLYDAVLFLDSPPDLHQRVVRSFFSLLLQKEAGPLQHGLLEVQLYNLVFEDGTARIAAGAIFPEATERDRLKAALLHFDSERAKALLAWLSGAP